MSETREAAIKRMTMRSMRRGIKEMDLILTPFARGHLDKMDEQALARYDALLGENDQDLYQWVSGQAEAPPEVRPMIEKIRAFLEADRAK